MNRINGDLYNSAAVCYNGELGYSYNKKLLPNYDIFDEKRYFKSGFDSGVFQINYNKLKINIGLQICEDLWDEDYRLKVSQELSDKGADFIINISASPYYAGKVLERFDLIKEKSKELQLYFIYCNFFF